MTPGEFLKDYRKRKNITVTKLAEALCFAHPYLTAIENNKRKMPKSVMEQLKKIMEKEEFEKLEKIVELEKIPENLKEEFLQIKEIKTIKQKKIPFYPDIEASAGYGRFNDSEIVEFLEVPEDLARPGNIAIRVAGDSMEPEIKDGDTIVIDTNCIECILNKIIVVNYQGAVYLKKYVEENGEIFLKSINPYYPKIRIGNRGELRVIGRLRSIMRYY